VPISRINVIAPALALVAGFVDAVGYLTLHGLFIAHMSGNTVKFGVEAGRGNLGAAAPVGVAVLLFVAGVALGTVAAELAARRRVRAVAAAVLAIQAGLIASFLFYGRSVVAGGQVSDHSLSGFYVLAALGVLSMGIQTAALRQFGGQSINTTYVTGVLTALTQETTNYLFWLHDRGRRDERHSFLGRVLGLGSRQDARRRVVLLGSVFLAYAAGGIAGSFSDGRIQLWSLLAPLCILGVVIAVDLRRPLAL
jgi:uncharacterized membrane protein YoaK (UPF0700 family)